MSDNQTLVYKKKKKKFKVFPIVNAILFIIIACAIMIPIYKVIITSIDAYSSYDFKWLPQKFSWGGYRAIITRSNLYHPFLISVITTIIGTFVGLLVVTLGGYVLIQWEMPGRNFFAYMLLFTMIFDGGMIPKFLVIKQLGLINTLWAVILPMAINVYNLVLMRNFFEGIPESLFEAAQIDGAGKWKEFWKVTFPLVMPFVTINLILSTKNFLMVFDQILSLTKGGPAQSTESISYLIYKNGMDGGQFGFQSANAVLFFVVIVAISIFQMTVMGKKEEQL